MKKLCLTLLALSAAFVSLSAASSRADNLALSGGLPTVVTVTPGQPPVFLQTSFGVIGLVLYDSPAPELGVISSPAPIIAVYISHGASSWQWTGFPMNNSYYATVPVCGNGRYEITVVTSMGTYQKTFGIQGLPNYEPGDPRIPMPIGDHGKF